MTTISTAFTNTAPTAGMSDTDTATLSGATSPTGAVTFYTYTDSQCTEGQSAAISSTGSESGPYTSASSGTLSATTYYWNAKFAGDANNNPATSSCETLQLIGKTSSSISTTLGTSSSLTLGSTEYDTATIGGTVAGVTPTGIVTYTYFTNGACSDTGTTPSVDLSGGTAPASSTTAALAAGSYSYYASYSGDSNYAKSGPSSCEPFTVQQGTLTIGTEVSPSTTPALGASVYDTATATGQVGDFIPTGTLTVTLYNGASCEGTPVSTQTGVSLGAQSTSMTDLNAGPYSYEASAYTGDSNYADPVIHVNHSQSPAGNTIGWYVTCVTIVHNRRFYN